MEDDGQGGNNKTKLSSKTQEIKYKYVFAKLLMCSDTSANFGGVLLS